MCALLAKEASVTTADGIALVLGDKALTAFHLLACAALVIPMPTAEVERGFSTMNDIKTLSRNRMLQSHALIVPGCA